MPEEEAVATLQGEARVQLFHALRAQGASAGDVRARSCAESRGGGAHGAARYTQQSLMLSIASHFSRHDFSEPLCKRIPKLLMNS